MRYYFLSKQQYEFRKNRSTEHAIIDFTEGTTKAVVEGKYSAGIVLLADDTNILFRHKCFRKLNEVIQIQMEKLLAG